MKHIKTFKSYVNESVGINGGQKDTLTELHEMTLGQLERIEDYAEMISDRMKQGQPLESWMFSEITQALNGLNSVHDAMDGIDGVKESELNEGSDPRTWSKAQIDKELRELNMGAKDAGDIDDTMAYDIAFDWVHDNAGVDKAIMKHYRVTDVVGFVANRIV